MGRLRDGPLASHSAQQALCHRRLDVLVLGRELVLRVEGVHQVSAAEKLELPFLSGGHVELRHSEHLRTALHPDALLLDRSLVLLDRGSLVSFVDFVADELAPPVFGEQPVVPGLGEVRASNRHAQRFARESWNITVVRRHYKQGQSQFIRQKTKDWIS